MISGDYFGNGDNTPLSPLFPFSHGLSYTSFNFSALAVDTSGLPAHGANGDALENLTVTVKVTATNVGQRAGGQRSHAQLTTTPRTLN
jgi:hypothetical protein